MLSTCSALAGRNASMAAFQRQSNRHKFMGTVINGGLACYYQIFAKHYFSLHVRMYEQSPHYVQTTKMNLTYMLLDFTPSPSPSCTHTHTPSHPHSFYACRHCFSQSSTNWHHAGPDKTILCQDCRLYFQRYGCMMPISDKRQPPEFLFKDYHDATVGSEDNSSPPAATGIQTTPISGRKTRNSNGSRGGSLRPGLRSAKPNFFKSDTDEDEGKKRTWQ